MNRRGFLKACCGGVAVAVVAPPLSDSWKGTIMATTDVLGGSYYNLLNVHPLFKNGKFNDPCRDNA